MGDSPREGDDGPGFPTSTPTSPTLSSVSTATASAATSPQPTPVRNGGHTGTGGNGIMISAPKFGFTATTLTPLPGAATATVVSPTASATSTSVTPVLAPVAAPSLSAAKSGGMIANDVSWQANINQALSLLDNPSSSSVASRSSDEKRSLNGSPSAASLSSSPSSGGHGSGNDGWQTIWRMGDAMMTSATECARTIISELGRPAHERTIPPIDTAQRRYRAHGLLFELATDVRIGDSFLYGGSNGANDEYAAKAASHEYKAAARIHAATRESTPHLPITPPLTMLLDWRGFRLRVTSDLPVNSTSLVYGTSVDTVTGAPLQLINTNPNYATVVNQLGERLHLRSHRAHIMGAHGQEETQIETSLPADVQGHVTANGHMYVTRLARIFPPEHSMMTRHLSVPEQSIFFRLFRGELIDSFHASTGRVLNPDALSAFTISDHPDTSSHHDDIAAATRYLLAEVVPKLADDLHQLLWQTKTNASSSSSSSSSATYLLTAQANALRDETHARGVNIRHLGAVYAMMPAASEARTVLLMDMVARTCKNILRDRLRRAYAPSLTTAGAGHASSSSSSASASSAASPYRAMVAPPRSAKRVAPPSPSVMTPSSTIIDFINRMCSGDNGVWALIKEQLQQRFGVIGVPTVAPSAIPGTEYTASDLFASVRSSLLYIIPYTLHQCGHRMIASVARAFSSQSAAALSAAHPASTDGYVFAMGDIEETPVIIRASPLIEQAHGHVLLEQVRTSRTRVATVAATRLDTAANKLTAPIQSAPQPEIDLVRSQAVAHARAHELRKEYQAADELLLRVADEYSDDVLIDELLTLWYDRRANGGIAGHLHLGGAATITTLSRAMEWDRHGDDKRLRDVRASRHSVIRNFVASVNARASDETMIPLLKHVTIAMVDMDEFAFSIGLNNARQRIANDGTVQDALWVLFRAALTADDYGMVSLIHELGLSVNRIADDEDNGRTPLMIACMRRDVTLVQCLLDLGANPNVRDHQGDTVLGQVVARIAESVSSNASSSPNASAPPTPSSSSHSASAAASTAANLSSVDVALLSRLRDGGANVDIGNYHDDTPLHIASYYGVLPLIIQLLLYRPDLNRVNHDGDNAVGIAALNGHATCVRRLLTAGGAMLTVGGRSLWNRVIAAKHTDVLRTLWSYSGGAVFSTDDLRTAVTSRDLPLVKLIGAWHATRYGVSAATVTVLILDLSISNQYSDVTDGILADIPVRRDHTCIFFAALLVALRTRDLPLAHRLYQLITDGDAIDAPNNSSHTLACTLHGSGCIPVINDDTGVNGRPATGRWATRDHEAIRFAFDMGIPLHSLFIHDTRELLVEAGRHGDATMVRDVLEKKRGVNLSEWLDKLAVEWISDDGVSAYPAWVTHRDLLPICKVLFEAGVPAQAALDRLQPVLSPNVYRYVAEAAIPYIHPSAAAAKKGGKEVKSDSDSKRSGIAASISDNEATTFLFGFYYDDPSQWSPLDNERIGELVSCTIGELLAQVQSRSLGNTITDALWALDKELPLTAALITSRHEIAAAILERCTGTNVDPVNLAVPSTGRTPLMVVTEVGMARMLLDGGATINIASNMSVTPLETPLSMQQAAGRQDIVDLLLEAGADPDYGTPGHGHGKKDGTSRATSRRPSTTSGSGSHHNGHTPTNNGGKRRISSGTTTTVTTSARQPRQSVAQRAAAAAERRRNASAAKDAAAASTPSITARLYKPSPANDNNKKRGTSSFAPPTQSRRQAAAAAAVTSTSTPAYVQPTRRTSRRSITNTTTTDASTNDDENGGGATTARRRTPSRGATTRRRRRSSAAANGGGSAGSDNDSVSGSDTEGGTTPRTSRRSRTVVRQSAPSRRSATPNASPRIVALSIARTPSRDGTTPSSSSLGASYNLYSSFTGGGMSPVSPIPHGGVHGRVPWYPTAYGKPDSSTDPSCSSCGHFPCTCGTVRYYQPSPSPPPPPVPVAPAPTAAVSPNNNGANAALANGTISAESSTKSVRSMVGSQLS